MNDDPRPPAGLKRAGKALWRQILTDFTLEVWETSLLDAACRLADRAADARKAIDADGAFVDGRFGPKPHPGLLVERQSLSAMAAILKKLGLHVTEKTRKYPRGFA